MIHSGPPVPAGPLLRIGSTRRARPFSHVEGQDLQNSVVASEEHHAVSDLDLELSRRLYGRGSSRVDQDDLFARCGPLEHLRSDNGPEFTAKLVRQWLARLGVQTLYIELGSPWENGYNESFNGKLRDEFLNGEIFYTLPEAVVLVERWRRLYNTALPHSACGRTTPRPGDDKAIVLVP